MWNLKKKVSEPTKQEQRNRYREQTGLSDGRGVGTLGEKDEGIKYKLMVTK